MDLWRDVEAIGRLATVGFAAEETAGAGRPALSQPGGESSSWALDRVSVHAASVAARGVSGDGVDIYPLDGEGIALCVTDVSGKGFPAALLSGVTRSVIRGLSSMTSSPAQALQRTNEILCGAGLGAMYVTVFLAWLDPSTGVVRYASAGHPRPLWRRSGSRRMRSFGRVTGPILGILERARFEEGTERLEPGGRLVVFTDGLLEARSASGALFGGRRLLRVMEAHRTEDAGGLCRSVLESIDRFQDGGRQDDATILVLDLVERDGLGIAAA